MIQEKNTWDDTTQKVSSVLMALYLQQSLLGLAKKNNWIIWTSSSLLLPFFSASLLCFSRLLLASLLFFTVVFVSSLSTLLSSLLFHLFSPLFSSSHSTSRPPPPLYPVSDPSAPTIRWHGTTKGIGFLPEKAKTVTWDYEPASHLLLSFYFFSDFLLPSLPPLFFYLTTRAAHRPRRILPFYVPRKLRICNDSTKFYPPNSFPYSELKRCACKRAKLDHLVSKPPCLTCCATVCLSKIK